MGLAGFSLASSLRQSTGHLSTFFLHFYSIRKTLIFQILRQRLAPIAENFRAGASETELVKRIGRNGDRDSNPETLQSHKIVISKIRLKRILREILCLARLTFW